MSGEVVTFAQLKGGAGKTTIVAYLAGAFAKSGKKVALIDMAPDMLLGDWFYMKPSRANIEYYSISSWRLAGTVEELQEGDVDVILVDSPSNSEADLKVASRVSDLVVVVANPSPADIKAIDNTVRFIGKERVPYRMLFNKAGGSKLCQDIMGKYSNRLGVTIPNRSEYMRLFCNGRAHGGKALEFIVMLCEEISDLVLPGDAYESEYKGLGVAS